MKFFSDFEDLKLGILGVRLPRFTIEEKYKKNVKLPENATNAEFLEALAFKGCDKLSLKEGDSAAYDVYAQRIKMELKIIEELGFVDYILLVWVIVAFCHERGIPTGAGRGSAAGSLVLYLIGV